VPDLGCGNGIFVDYLRRRGRIDVAGYDPYSPAPADPGVLGRRYRLVLSTDVIEHVPSPAEHLERACDQVAAGATSTSRRPTPTTSTSPARRRSARCCSSPTTGTWSRRPGFWRRG
jgi:2-polyprenyl-3-methyl-5-hydroxy-6-metoxy-1,4-benzoquinol methylase